MATAFKCYLRGNWVRGFLKVHVGHQGVFNSHEPEIKESLDYYGRIADHNLSMNWNTAVTIAMISLSSPFPPAF